MHNRYVQGLEHQNLQISDICPAVRSTSNVIMARRVNISSIDGRMLNIPSKENKCVYNVFRVPTKYGVKHRLAEVFSST